MQISRERVRKRGEAELISAVLSVSITIEVLAIHTAAELFQYREGDKERERGKIGIENNRERGRDKQQSLRNRDLNLKLANSVNRVSLILCA